MDRLDKLLVDQGLVQTRSQAQLLVKEGHVIVDGHIIKKPSFKTDSTNIKITKEEVFVGRGAHKIEGALIDFSIDVNGLVVADVGASTGGFTNYVLTRGAKKVYAIDVGHDQLAPSLVNHSQVVNMEGTNIRDLDGLEESADIAVVDLSFISLKLVLKNIHSLLKDDGKVIALVKPQFEVGKDNLGKNGLVKNNEITLKTILNLFNWCNENNLSIADFSTCSIKGKTGNQEYFFYFDKSLEESSLQESKIKEVIGVNNE